MQMGKKNKFSFVAHCLKHKTEYHLLEFFHSSPSTMIIHFDASSENDLLHQNK